MKRGNGGREREGEIGGKEGEGVKIYREGEEKGMRERGREEGTEWKEGVPIFPSTLLSNSA